MIECRHGSSEDCPGCMQETIDALVRALKEISACAICGYSLNGKEDFRQLAALISKFNSELQKRVKIAERALAIVGGTP